MNGRLLPDAIMESRENEEPDNKTETLIVRVVLVVAFIVVALKLYVIFTN